MRVLFIVVVEMPGRCMGWTGFSWPKTGQWRALVNTAVERAVSGRDETVRSKSVRSKRQGALEGREGVAGREACSVQNYVLFRILLSNDANDLSKTHSLVPDTVKCGEFLRQASLEGLYEYVIEALFDHVR